jgi:ABC-type bacteriocin/lantibiotic exporter with double-glycine peptidase domain
MQDLRAAHYPGGPIFFALFIILLTGCATAPQTARLLEHPQGLPQKHELTQVPFYPQKKYQCGPAALATVLQQSGVNISPLELVPEIYIPARQGSLQIEILASSRRHGRIAYRIEPNLQSLFKEVSAGNPVLVLQNLGLSWAPTWHYAVVAGFDFTSEKVILRSGVEERHQTSLNTFERTWARGKYWGIVVLPPDKLPETADAQRVLRSLAGPTT